MEKTLYLKKIEYCFEEPETVKLIFPIMNKKAVREFLKEFINHKEAVLLEFDK